jgi:two-component system, cell cycle sensor histidine kinase and response regulator CckA
VEKYRILFDLESDALALIDIETGKMFEINQAFIDLYGYSREEILKMKNMDFSAEPEMTRQTTEARGPYVPLRYHKKKDGSVFPTEITASIFKYKGRDVLIAAMRDITERKRLESQLQRSQKMESMGLLAGGVAHDLNNVLSGIIGYPDLLLLELPENSKLIKSIKKIQESGHRAAAIVDDLLTIARGVATAREPLNLNDLINDYLNSPDFIRLEQFHPAVTIKTDLESNLFNMPGSNIHIRKVLMNLISNASEAIAGNGSVTISTMNRRYIDKPLKVYDDVNVNEYVILSVSDNGSGISPNDLERIFEPFYTKKIMGRSGTGLGLAVVWNVVRDHEGYIDVKSDESGTTFELYFPTTRDEISYEAKSVPIREYKGNGETVLVVDDVQSQREITCQILDSIGYKATAVSSGEKAVTYLTEHAVDLLLLDMIMDPGINGRETYQRIKRIHPKQKAIIVSGFSETDEVKQAQKLGAGMFLKKPFTLEQIGIAIRDELKK